MLRLYCNFYSLLKSICLYPHSKLLMIDWQGTVDIMTTDILKFWNVLLQGIFQDPWLRKWEEGGTRLWLQGFFFSSFSSIREILNPEEVHMEETRSEVEPKI